MTAQDEQAKTMIGQYERIVRDGNLEKWVEDAVRVVDSLSASASVAKTESDRLYDLANNLRGKIDAARKAFHA